MLLGYLLGLEEGKLSERERLAEEERKRREKELFAIREEYMLGLLKPFVGKDRFKVVIPDPKKFDFSMVRYLLWKIDSPAKYYKHYAKDGKHILEVSYLGEEEYKDWKRTELKKTITVLGLMLITFLSLFSLNEYVLHIENFFASMFYNLFTFCSPFTVGALADEFAFPQKDKSILGYGKV